MHNCTCFNNFLGPSRLLRAIQQFQQTEFTSHHPTALLKGELIRNHKRKKGVYTKSPAKISESAVANLGQKTPSSYTDLFHSRPQTVIQPVISGSPRDAITSDLTPDNNNNIQEKTY